jgi:hypothetical protein
MRTVKRPRRYVAEHWITLLRPVLRYSSARDAYVLRVVGSQQGPVLRVDRRAAGLTDRPSPFKGVERRRTSAA